MKELHLLGKLVKLENCPVVFSYQPGADWKDHFDVKLGTWYEEGGYLIGREPGNFGGILFSKKSFDHDIIFSFTVKTASFSKSFENGNNNKVANTLKQV